MFKFEDTIAQCHKSVVTIDKKCYEEIEGKEG